MTIMLLGVSYKKTPVDIRERLSVSKDGLSTALSTLSHVAQEALVLSTCNRTEIYAVFPNPDEGRAALMDYASRYSGMPVTVFANHAYALADSEAARHIFSVASGLDSMALGEYQIQGQVREAFELAKEKGTVGPLLSSLFRNALRVGKRIRAETGVGHSNPSLSDGALELAKKTVAPLSLVHVLIIGAGEVSRLTAEKLQEEGIAGLFVVSRTLESAEQLVGRLAGEAIAPIEVSEKLLMCDLVISCTSAPHYTLRHDMVKEALVARQRGPLTIIDLAVPRDVEPSVGDLPGVRLYDIDDMEGLAGIDPGYVEAALDEAQAIIEEETSSFQRWLASLEITPTIVALREQAESIRAGELTKAFSKLKGLSEHEKQVVVATTQAIVNKLLHRPIVNLRTMAAAGESQSYAQAASAIFGLDNNREPSQGNEEGEEQGQNEEKARKGRNQT